MWSESDNLQQQQAAAMQSGQQQQQPAEPEHLQSLPPPPPQLQQTTNFHKGLQNGTPGEEFQYCNENQGVSEDDHRPFDHHHHHYDTAATVRVGSHENDRENSFTLNAFSPSIMNHLHMDRGLLDHLDDPENNADLLSNTFLQTNMMAMSADDHHEIKLPTAKEKTGYLRKYADKYGLNQRGMYIVCCLGILTFALFLVILVMAITRPSKFFEHALEICQIRYLI